MLYILHTLQLYISVHVAVQVLSTPLPSFQRSILSFEKEHTPKNRRNYSVKKICVFSVEKITVIPEIMHHCVAAAQLS